jgi:hypothetical protein
VAIGLAVFVPRACRRAGERFGVFVLRTLIAPAAAGLPALGVGLWLARSVRPETWLGTAACAAITAAVALCGVVAVATSRWERARYLAVLRRLARWRSGAGATN